MDSSPTVNLNIYNSAWPVFNPMYQDYDWHVTIWSSKYKRKHNLCLWSTSSHEQNKVQKEGEI